MGEAAHTLSVTTPTICQGEAAHRVGFANTRAYSNDNDTINMDYIISLHFNDTEQNSFYH